MFKSEFYLYNKSKAKKVNHYCLLAKNALSELGHSRSYHIYELDLTYLKKKENSNASARFLLKMYNFYSSLDKISRQVFINDFLEKDSSYPFWYLMYGESINHHEKVFLFLKQFERVF